MGVVFRARDEQLDREVAVKVLPAGTFPDEDARKRFLREARIVAKLNHPNVAMAFDFGQQEGIDYLVTEYVSGTTLDAKITKESLLCGTAVALLLLNKLRNPSRTRGGQVQLAADIERHLPV
jgi:eukaryotic-like serine/threonine-protein kinase